MCLYRRFLTTQNTERHSGGPSRATDNDVQKTNSIITILLYPREPLLYLSANPGEPCHRLFAEWLARRCRAGPHRPRSHRAFPADGERALRPVADKPSRRERDRGGLSVEAAAFFLPWCHGGRVRGRERGARGGHGRRPRREDPRARRLGRHEGEPCWHVEKRRESAGGSALEGAEAPGPLGSERGDDDGAFVCLSPDAGRPRSYDLIIFLATHTQVNPASAHCLLSHFVALERGQWVVQNGANSAVRHFCWSCEACDVSGLG